MRQKADLPLAEFARALGVNRTTVYRWIAAKQIEVIKRRGMGGERVYVSAAEFERIRKLYFKEASMSHKRLKLYWCSTDDHDEDWFMVARNARQAASLHADWEGYDPGDAEAEFVADIPEGWQGICMHCRKPWTEETLKFPSGRSLADAYCPHCDASVIGWPSDELLEACGGKILDHGRDEDKTVVLAGRKFSMGELEVIVRRKHDDQFESEGRGRPNGTKRKPRDPRCN